MAKLSQIFGFTKRGRSLVGKLLEKVRIGIRLRRLAGVFILFLAGLKVASSFALASNVGGIPTINLTPTDAVRIETATDVAVQVPIKVQYISQRYSWHHSGIDLVAPTGTPVYPMMDGVVTYTEEGWLGYGHHVIVDHGANLTTLYAHFSKISVKTGEKVTVKTKLGESGSTGFSTGPHLHFELRQNGAIINPEELLPEIIVK